LAAADSYDMKYCAVLGQVFGERAAAGHLVVID
jgi:hypothetical protein